MTRSEAGRLLGGLEQPGLSVGDKHGTNRARSGRDSEASRATNALTGPGSTERGGVRRRTPWIIGVVVAATQCVLREPKVSTQVKVPTTPLFAPLSGMSSLK